MKTKFYFAAIAAACAGLFFATGCNKDNGNDESEAPSIKKQWLYESTDSQSGEKTTSCIDIAITKENTFYNAMSGKPYVEAEMITLPENVNPDNFYIAPDMGYEITSIEEIDKTSGKISLKGNPFTMTEGEGVLSYSKLTNSSVEFSYEDENGNPKVLECKIATEFMTIYDFSALYPPTEE